MEDLECCPVCYVVFQNCSSYHIEHVYGRLVWLVHTHRGNVVFHKFPMFHVEPQADIDEPSQEVKADGSQALPF